jgi:hypothetical protein
VGNGKPATIGIFIFIAILVFMLWHSKAHATEVDFAAGSSFGSQGYGPAIGIEVRQEVQSGLYVTGGTDLWGATEFKGQVIPNNWDWHATLEGCKWAFCAGIGPAFVQRVDAINGAHTNYALSLSWRPTERFSVTIRHLSDAGTTNPNEGRQALMLSYRLQ